MLDRSDRSCPEEDGEELLQREEITPPMDSPLPGNNLFSSATVNQSNSNGHCQCQCSPAKRRSPFTEKQSHQLEEEEVPTAKRQLLLDEQDNAAVFALRGGYSKIVLPSHNQPPVPGSESPSEWRSGSAHPPLPPLGRTFSDASSGITKVVEGSLNSCKEFVPLHRTSSNCSNLEGSPNSHKDFSSSISQQPTAMLPPRTPLHRTVSDPSPVSMTTVKETQARRANRMMHRVKEMGKWFEHMVHQAEAEEHPEHCKLRENIVSQGLSPILPPRPPLHRTVSDPTPAVMEDTPNSKEIAEAIYQVKHMLHKVKEIGKWLEHIVHEAEAEEQAEHSRPEDTIVSQDGSEADDKKDEEAVSVEKVGECLSVQFKCLCGKGYKILLSGKECYYKLL